jgi:hypothetical protein
MRVSNAHVMGSLLAAVIPTIDKFRQSFSNSQTVGGRNQNHSIFKSLKYTLASWAVLVT